MRGDETNKNGRIADPAPDDRATVDGNTPPDPDRINRLLNTLFDSVASQPLSPQLQALADRLRTERPGAPDAVEVDDGDTPAP